MDEDSIKQAFRKWLYNLAKDNGWLHSDGKIVLARLAEYFQVSRQTVTNWLLGVSCLSTQKVNEVIAPRMGISTAEFWHQMQLIDRELKGLSPVVGDESSEVQIKTLDTAEELFNCIRGLSQEEQDKLRRMYLTCLAQDKF
jgi:hypothetical protein